MKFNNRPNKSYKIDGKEIWESRSPALVGVVIVKYNERNYVLIGQRGPGAADNHGLWNVPCGYLDWNESGTNGIIREIYEETGLNIKGIRNVDIFSYDLSQPFYVNTKPNENRQNVSLSYGIYFECEELPKLTTDHCEPGEVSDVKWVEVNQLDVFDFAYNHNERINHYLNYISDTFTK